MGDPECQVILPRLKSDLVKIIDAAVNNRLEKVKIKWKQKKSMTIVLCANGYPNNYKKNLKLTKIEKKKINKNDFIYHAGTKIKDGQLLSNGGRILNITSLGNKYLKIRHDIISVLKKINLKQSFYRKDIGWKVIKKDANY